MALVFPISLTSSGFVKGVIASLSNRRTQYAAPPSMYRKNIVPPEDYLRLLQELSDKMDSENSDNASDVDEAEIIEHSDHANDSEIDSNISN